MTEFGSQPCGTLEHCLLLLRLSSWLLVCIVDFGESSKLLRKMLYEDNMKKIKKLIARAKILVLGSCGLFMN